MEELKKLLEDLLNETLIQAVLSDPRAEVKYRKIKVRPVLLGGKLMFQEAAWDGKQEFHTNLEKEEMQERIRMYLGQEFCQLQAGTGSVRVSKKGKITVSRKKKAVPGNTGPGMADAGTANKGNTDPGKAEPENANMSCREKRIPYVPSLSHNRQRRYLLPEGVPVPFLVKLGVMTAQGKVAAARYDKFRQVNRFLEFIEDVRDRLPGDREIRIIDFGCGKSYLTFAVYYYLHEVCHLPLRVTGLDLKEDVIDHCNVLAQEFGYENLRFQAGDVADYEEQGPVDLVISLHACDTATDYALAKALEWKTGVILSVPCCQHELNRQMKNEILEPVLRYGILKERMAALVTDGLRAALLEEAGYQVQILEFIDMEHTPKNLLIRAVQRKKTPAHKSERTDAENGLPVRESSRRIEQLEQFLHVQPALQRLLDASSGPILQDNPGGAGYPSKVQVRMDDAVSITG